MLLSEIKPNPKNPRLIKDERFENLKKSIQDFPEMLTLRPIVIDDANVILGGNMRYKACKALGLKDVPVTVAKGLTEAQKAEFIIKDNVSGGEWDWKSLTDEWDRVKLEEWGLEFPELEVTKLEAVEDDFDTTPPVEPKSKLGDLYQLGEHRLLCGDATKVEDVERLMAGGRSELLFTSPPYADQREYNGRQELTSEHLATFIRASYGFVDLLAVNLGISRKDGAVNPYWDDYIKEAENCGLKLISWNIWDKGEAGSLGNQTAPFPLEHEWIFVFGDESPELRRIVESKHGGVVSSATNRQADGSSKERSHVVHALKKMGSVFRSSPEKAGAAVYKHPAMFPIELPSVYIQSCTQEGQSVYEPFGGAGSTLIACEQTNRKCYMMELSPQYIDVIIARWEKLTGKKAELLA